MPPSIVPTATYRLQFNASFPFDAATAIVDYLNTLGISHCYASSYFKAVPGSTHGYDVADPTQLNPEIGDHDTFDRWVSTLRARGMGHIVDLVPNHMGIAHSSNPWWQDVLENGPSSRYAHFFDIDWHPLKPELEDKVLLPILGDSYGAALERQEITLQYVNGVFSARYADCVLPISLDTYGIYNSLAQLAIKIGAPGVPDFYLGTELWDFSFVDPDNRRPVDYGKRRALLDELDAAREQGRAGGLASDLLQKPEGDSLKLFATTTMLRARGASHDVFGNGSYEPLATDGSRRGHVFAFARVLGQRQALLAVPRLVATLKPDGDAPIGDVWADTRIHVPESAPRCYKQLFTGRCVPAIDDAGRTWIKAADVFEAFPIAFLEAA